MADIPRVFHSLYLETLSLTLFVTEKRLHQNLCIRERPLLFVFCHADKTSPMNGVEVFKRYFCFVL